MNQQKHVIGSPQASSTSRTPRGDRATAAIVRKGITLQQIHGTKYAAEFLKEKQIDMEIVMRVLLNLSEQRRHDDVLEFAADDGIFSTAKA